MQLTVTVDTASACAILNLTNNGGTLAFSTNTLTTTGSVTLGGAVTAGAGGKLWSERCESGAAAYDV